MRWILSVPLFFAMPTFGLAAQCALTAPVPMTGTSTSTASTEPVSDASALPPSLASAPFVAHVEAAGAAIQSLETVHGLRVVLARSGEQFMIFDVTPDGSAAVAGVPIEMTPAQLHQVAGKAISDLGTTHGLEGFFVRNGPQFQVFYATPDGQSVVPGVMWDSTGKDVTRAQVAAFPGVVPTVEVEAPSASQAATQPLALLESTTHGTIGAVSTPKVFMFMDPQCIFSVRAFQALQPYVQSGRLRLAVIPLSVLDYEDSGQSTRSALALLSDAPDQIVPAWQAGQVSNTPDPAAASRLAANMAVAQALGLKGTPMFWWRRPDGTAAHADGMPPDVQAFIAGLGG
jgi:hypothetical protein